MRRALNTSNSVKAAGQIRHNLHTAGGRDRELLLLHTHYKCFGASQEKEREKTPTGSHQASDKFLNSGKKRLYLPLTRDARLYIYIYPH